LAAASHLLQVIPQVLKAQASHRTDPTISADFLSAQSREKDGGASIEFNFKVDQVNLAAGQSLT
jgi:hypothetical protein